MQTEHQQAREQLITALLEGRSFQEVSQSSPVPLKRAMAYRLLRAVRTQGKGALQEVLSELILNCLPCDKGKREISTL